MDPYLIGMRNHDGSDHTIDVGPALSLCGTSEELRNLLRVSFQVYIPTASWFIACDYEVTWVVLGTSPSTSSISVPWIDTVSDTSQKSKRMSEKRLRL